MFIIPNLYTGMYKGVTFQCTETFKSITGILKCLVDWLSASCCSVMEIQEQLEVSHTD